MDYHGSGSWPVLILPWKPRAREKHGAGYELTEQRRLGRVAKELGQW